MDIFEEIKKLTLPKTNQLPPSQIPQPTTNKGLEAINQIRSSIRPTSFKPLSETSQFRPISEARPLTTPLPAIRPTPKPQLRDLTRETIPTTFGTFKPVISPIIKQTPTPQLFKPTTLKSADISQQPIYRLAKFSQRPIAVEKIKRTAEKVSKSFSKVFDSSDKITATERLLEGLSGVGAVLSLPNEIAIQPIYDSLKLGYKGLRTGQITDQDIEDYFYTIGGEKGTIFDAIGTNEQEFGKKYGDNLLLLARFLDFAPELIDLPTGRAKNVATFARKVKIPQEAIEEAGKLAKQDEVIKAIANFEAQTGEKISKQAKDLITKTVDNPKNFINTLSKGGLLASKRTEQAQGVGLTDELLIQEAKKYKTADEFVMAQEKNILYHGTGEVVDKLKPISDDVGILWTAPKRNIAESYIPDARDKIFVNLQELKSKGNQPFIFDGRGNPSWVFGEKGKKIGIEIDKVKTNSGDLLVTKQSADEILKLLESKGIYDEKTSSFIIGPANKVPAGKLYQLKLKQGEELKIKDLRRDYGLFGEEIADTDRLEDFLKAKKDGYDGVKILDFNHTDQGDTLLHESIGLFESGINKLDQTDQILTKEQLTDIWKQAQTGEKISKQAKDLITKTVDNPKNFINTLSKEAKQKAIVPQIDETTKYIKELVERQKRAKAIETPNILQRLGQIAREVDVKLQDFTTPINQAVNKAIKEGKIISPSKNPIFQIDRVLRSDSIASQFVKDEGLAKIIQNVDNLDEFNQYLIAKSVAELSKIRPDVKTGRNLVRDAKLIKDLDAKYNDFAEQIFNYNQKVLKLGRNSGIISGDLYKTLTESRLKYVPLQRIFNEIEEVAAGVTPRAVASLGKQTIVQRLKGSEREIANPLESMLTNTYKAVAQSERNIAAQQIANLVKEKAIPGKLLDKGEKFNSNEVISYFDNGKLERVFVGKDLARAAKYLNKENTNFLVNILKIPTRILQVGAVGLNLPFVISNLVRDQATAAIVSGKPFRNTILNPVGFGKALFQSYGEGKVYDDFIRAGAGFSSIDLTRDTAKTIKQLRDEANPFIKGAKTITNPVELFKAVEEFISKAETTTRLQVFTTTREDLLRRGISAENAEILAADAARNVTANFARRGEFGTVLNAVIPFFNATIQGARTLRNSFVNNPVRTTALFGATVAVPTTVTTLWNISEPERKKVYDQIPDYEKERNFIVIPPVVTYDDRGYPFYFRIPKPQGYNQLADPVRRLLEVSYESIPDAVTSITNNILGSTTGYTIPFNEQGARQLTSQFTPQIIRPAIEASTGVNLFTGQRIIPRGLENLPPEEQVKETTSFTARQIGKNLGVSPLLVENTIKTSGAGVGEQLLNISDRAAAFATGQVPQEQIGGRDPFESVVNVFYRASGGADVGRIYDQLEKIDQEKALLNLKVKDMILKNDISGLQSITPNLTKQQFNALETSITEKEFAKTLSPQDRALFNATNSQLDALRNLNTGLGSRIDEILIIKESFKDRKKIDTKNFIFKDSQTKTKKIKLPAIKKPKKVRIPKPKKPRLRLSKVRIKKPKKRKTIKLQTRI